MFRCKRAVVLTFACLRMLFSHNTGSYQQPCITVMTLMLPWSVHCQPHDLLEWFLGFGL